MSTLVASLTPGMMPAPVQLDVVITDATVTSWSIRRNDPTGTRTLWLSTGTVLTTSLVDYTAPFNTPVTYTLTVRLPNKSTYSVTSNAVTVPVTDGCYLTDPVTGVTLPVMLVTWPNRQREPRNQLLDVLGRSDPVGLVDEHRSPAGVWQLFTYTDAENDALTDLLTTRAPVALRVGPGKSVKNVTVLVGRISEGRYTDAGADQRRMFTVEVQEVGSVPSVLPLGATLGGLATLVPTTLADLADLRPTLLSLSQVRTP